MAIIFGQGIRAVTFGLMFWLAASSALDAAEKARYFRFALPCGEMLFAQCRETNLRLGLTMEQLAASKPYTGVIAGPSFCFFNIDLPVASNALPAGCVRIKVNDLYIPRFADAGPSAAEMKGKLILYYPGDFDAMWTYHTGFSGQLGNDPATSPAVQIPALDKIALKLALRPGGRKHFRMALQAKAGNAAIDDIRQNDRSIEVQLTATDPRGTNVFIKHPPVFSQLGFG